MNTVPLFRVSVLISVSLGILIGLCGCFVTLPHEKKEEIPLVSTVEFKDGGAYGSLLSITAEYGNINTEFIESDIKALGIVSESHFILKYEMNVFEVFLGDSYDEVPQGLWVALWRGGRLRIARNLENAAITLGCKEGDKLFIKRKNGNGK